VAAIVETESLEEGGATGSLDDELAEGACRGVGHGELLLVLRPGYAIFLLKGRKTMCDHCGCRAFAEIAELTEEHERILELAWRATDGGAATARDELIPLLARHVAKEEDGLYPLLVAAGALDAEVVATLEAEHTAIDAHAAGPRWNRRAYYELAAHIEQEEMELFPAAMFSFDDADWAHLADLYQRVPTQHSEGS
jgi:hemerythrin-like domain-containing protein